LLGSGSQPSEPAHCATLVDHGLTYGVIDGLPGIETSDVPPFAARANRSPQTQALDALPAQVNRQGNAHQANQQGQHPFEAGQHQSQQRCQQQTAGCLGERKRGSGLATSKAALMASSGGNGMAQN
jgi:hypothetical protein